MNLGLTLTKTAIQIFRFSVVFFVLFSSALLRAQPVTDFNKDMTDQIMKSYGRMMSALYISYEMTRDNECRNYKDIPKFSVEEWINASVIAQKKEKEELILDFSKNYEKALAMKNDKGDRMTEAAIYLPLKEATKKSLLAMGSKSNVDICERLATIARGNYQNAVSAMKVAFELEKQRLQKK